jgi:hypothetical protein
MFVDGKKHGNGLLLFNKGDKYEGEFYEDKIEGEGEFTFSDGKVEKGIWRNGKLQEKN